jgi:hypothetical protein
MPFTLIGQQTSTSINHLFRPRLWNPASRGVTEFNKVVISHQQRHLTIPGWRSVSQFLDFNSEPMGKRGSFGWGLMLANDLEHTENRLSISGATAVSVIKTEALRLNVGLNLGLINWSSNYDDVRVIDRDDVLIDRPSNLIELDAGAGIDFGFKNKSWDIQVGAAAGQLPQNLASGQASRTFPIYRHMMVGGLALFEPIHNLKVGPSFFYKGLMLTDENRTEILNSNSGAEGNLDKFKQSLDIGLKAELDRQGMWFGGSYRLQNSALSAAFGMQVFVSDSAKHPKKYAVIGDLNAGFSYPMSQATAFGPTMEIGLSVNFGRELKYRNQQDTLRYIRGSFWKDDGLVSRHIQEHLIANSPPGVRGTTFVTDRNVTLTYEFPDQNLQYIGTTPEISGDTLMALGVEWVGVDGFLEGMVNEVIREALQPDTINVINPEDLEALKDMVFVELSSLLKANETEAFFDADGMVYEGELGTNNKTEDTLIIPVVYNGADTIIGVPLNRYISNLELACLKLFAMRKKLQYELTMKYGEEIAFVLEGEKINSEDVVGRKRVMIRKPRILPNHPHQDVFQINQVKIKFIRDDGAVTVTKAGEAEDESERLILEDKKSRKRENPLRFRDKR